MSGDNKFGNMTPERLDELKRVQEAGDRAAQSGAHVAIGKELKQLAKPAIGYHFNRESWGTLAKPLESLLRVAPGGGGFLLPLLPGIPFTPLEDKKETAAILKEAGLGHRADLVVYKRETLEKKDFIGADSFVAKGKEYIVFPKAAEAMPSGYPLAAINEEIAETPKGVLIAKSRMIATDRHIEAKVEYADKKTKSKTIDIHEHKLEVISSENGGEPIKKTYNRMDLIREGGGIQPEVKKVKDPAALATLDIPTTPYITGKTIIRS